MASPLGKDDEGRKEEEKERINEEASVDKHCLEGDRVFFFSLLLLLLFLLFLP